MTSVRSASRLGKHAIGRVLDTLLPQRCLKCSAAIGGAGALCGECWTQVNFLTPPHCEMCGVPFEYDPGAGALCASCSAVAPPFDRARAVFRYDADSRDLVIAYKHADATHATPAFAGWLARAGEQLIADADVIAPVPLHRWRLLRRRFNQSALLAAAVARLADRSYAPQLLVRRRPTPSQSGRNAGQRRRNVKGAFKVGDDQDISGARVLLIDDVYTTGATVAECARVLVRSGARAVDVLTLARVIRPADPF